MATKNVGFRLTPADEIPTSTRGRHSKWEPVAEALTQVESGTLHTLETDSDKDTTSLAAFLRNRFEGLEIKTRTVDGRKVLFVRVP